MRRGKMRMLKRIGEAMPTFDAWYADLLGERETEVRGLMNDGGAVRFLIAWSLFESRCFKESASEREIRDLSSRIVGEGFDGARLSAPMEHFHERYQDKSRLRHLLNKRPGEYLTELLRRPVGDLTPSERVFVVLFVVFRFRNNIFHGTKGVQTWIQYGEQIRLCTEAMQAVISHVHASTHRAAA